MYLLQVVFFLVVILVTLTINNNAFVGKDTKSITTILMSWSNHFTPSTQEDETKVIVEKSKVLAAYSNIFNLCKDNQQSFSSLSNSMMNQVVSYTATDFLDWIIEDKQ